MKFDPAQYVIDAGWDLTGIEQTLAKGVAEGDRRLIREEAAAQGLTGAELDDAVHVACGKLLVFCAQRLADQDC